MSAEDTLFPDRTTVRRRLSLMVPRAFAADLAILAGPNGSRERVVTLCLALHQERERADRGRLSPVLAYRLRRVVETYGPQERVELWLSPEQAEAITRGAARCRVSAGQYVAGVVSAVAQQLVARAQGS